MPQKLSKPENHAQQGMDTPTLVGLPLDMTARTDAEEAVRRSEERFRALIEHTADMVMIVGPDGTIHYRNPTSTGLGLLGRQLEELIGKNGLDRVHPEDRPRVQALLADTVQRPGPSPVVTIRVRHADGSWRVMEAILNNHLPFAHFENNF